jgi:hypothetical protein
VGVGGDDDGGRHVRASECSRKQRRAYQCRRAEQQQQHRSFGGGPGLPPVPLIIVVQLRRPGAPRALPLCLRPKSVVVSGPQLDRPSPSPPPPPPPPPPASSPLRHQHQRSDGCRCCSRWSSMSSSPAPAGEKHTANCLSTRRCSGAAPWSSLSDGGAGSDELTSLAAAVVGLGLGLAAAAARILSDPFRRPVLRGR